MPKPSPVDLNTLVDKEYSHVIGIDEAGWGCAAGPLAVAAAVVPWDTKHGGLKDSKRYTTHNARRKGCELAASIVEDFYLELVDVEVIEYYSAGQALAYSQRKLAVNFLEKFPDALVVVDGNKAIYGVPAAQQLCLPAADATVPAVSAASIIAKYHRDCYMMSEDLLQEWEFHKNKGYPTPEHLEKLKKWGPIKGFHRMNVCVVKDAYERRGWYGPKGS